jgi:hypothetical protein
MYSDSSCYYQYDANDLGDYSTNFYEDKAVAAITTHDYTSPLFLYLAFQAVHDPFSDSGGATIITEIPSDTLDTEVYEVSVRVRFRVRVRFIVWVEFGVKV